MRVIKFFSSAHFAPFLWSFPSGLLFVALKNPSPVHYNEKKNYYNYYTEIKIFHFFRTLMQISFSKLVENASDQTERRERQFSGVCPKTENLTIKPCKMFGRVVNDKFGYLKKSRQKPSICSSLKITRLIPILWMLLSFSTSRKLWLCKIPLECTSNNVHTMSWVPRKVITIKTLVTYL